MSTVGANGRGRADITACLCNTTVKQMFLVVEELMVEALLGADFFDKHKAVIDFAHHRLTLGTQTAPIAIGDVQEQAPFQVFTVAI